MWSKDNIIILSKDIIWFVGVSVLPHGGDSLWPIVINVSGSSVKSRRSQQLRRSWARISGLDRPVNHSCRFFKNQMVKNLIGWDVQSRHKYCLSWIRNINIVYHITDAGLKLLVSLMIPGINMAKKWITGILFLRVQRRTPKQLIMDFSINRLCMNISLYHNRTKLK